MAWKTCQAGGASFVALFTHRPVQYVAIVSQPPGTMAALVSFLTGPHSPSRLSPPVCFRPTHPPFLQALASSCAGATSWLPVTCERIRCPHLVRVVQLPVSHPIACALPVPPCLKSCGFHHWPPTCQPIVTPCCLGGFEVCTPRGVCGRCRIRTCCSSEAF